MDLYELVLLMEKEDQFGETHISKYVTFNLRETIETIEAYLNSKHISGDTDSLGREKPFFNLVNAAVNICYRATDTDRKDVRVKATKSNQYVTAFLATVLLQEWMRKNNFGVFLNEWGRTLSRYGSAVSKFVEKEGNLYSEIVPWNRLICDPVDFNNNLKIEKIWMTPAQLKQQKGYDQKLVKELIENLVQRKTMQGQQKDNKSEYILLYEVHGELPLSYLTENKDDEDTFLQQMHVISFQDKTDKEFKANTLISGREAKDPYFITHLIKEDGRTLAIGAVEHLFEAQWMVNHSQKQIKDQLDLASKLLFQTSDAGFVGQNVLTSIENGDILIHAINQPLTQINNKPDIVAMQANLQMWQAQGNQINGYSEAMMGANPPSGTAWRLQDAILQESHSLFDLMAENKGLALEEMLREYVIPYLKKQLGTSEEIAAILEDHQVTQLDMMYVPNEAKRRMNQKIKDTVLSGQVYDPTQQAGDMAASVEQIKSELATFGNQRFIRPGDIETKTWKEILKDIEWELEIDVTGEGRDSRAIMQTLTTVLQTIATNPMILQDPNAKMIFSKIMNEAGGVSPIELQATAQAGPQVPQAPQMAQTPQTPPITNQ